MVISASRAAHEMVDGLLHGMEAKGTKVGAYFVPDRHLLYSRGR